MIYFVLSTLVVLSGFWIIFWLHNRYQLDILVEPVSTTHPLPFISICIPARNEERNIRGCVQAALLQSYRDYEVVVVDDQSTDGTSKILAQLSLLSNRLKVIPGLDLPDRWAGKPFALHQAVSNSKGEWLCFVDADTFLAPEALSSCYLKAVETGADLFTVMTRQIMGSFWEKVVMPIVMTALSVGFSPRRVNNPNLPDAIANGQFILIKRTIYEAVGGHTQIKDMIVEDKALAELVKSSGYRLILADGSRLVSTRMYTSLVEMWEGWTKNIYLGLSDQLKLLFLGVLGVNLSVLAALFLPIWPLLSYLWWLKTGNWLAFAIGTEAIVFWLAIFVLRGLTAVRLGIPFWYAFTTPLGAGIFAAMMIASAWKVISGRGVSWKGRIYQPK